MEKYSINQKDKEILRTLAQKVAQYAARPLEEQKKRLWKEHNDLKNDQPLVFIDPENGWNEIILPQDLACESPLAREWERMLKIQLYHAESLKDDMVICDSFPVGLVTENDGWGLPVRKTGGANGGAYHIESAITDYDEAFEKLHFPHYWVNREETEALHNAAHEVFDGVLTVEPYHTWWWSLGLTWWYIELRGLEDFLCDFIVEPESVHRMMNLLCQGTLDLLDQLEEQGWLYSNNGNRYVGSGGFGFTGDLPIAGAGCSTKDMWGFVESQETSSVSGEMYGEFIFPYHKKIAERFGLSCYGCCEAFENRWKYVSQIRNLRRVSCSPWCSREAAAGLLGNRYIASHKLSPTPLASHEMDEAEVRRNLRDVLDHSAGTIPELIMKDNHTLGHQPHNAVRWVELAREEIANT